MQGKVAISVQTDQSDPKAGRKRGRGREDSAASQIQTCQAQHLLLAFAHAVLSVRSVLSATSPGSLLFNLKSQFRQRCLLQDALLDLHLSSSAWTGTGVSPWLPSVLVSSIRALFTLSYNSLGQSVSPARLFVEDYVSSYIYY